MAAFLVNKRDQLFVLKDIGTLLKTTIGKLEELNSSSDPVIDIFEKAFTG